jgi:hypothetical protein
VTFRLPPSRFGRRWAVELSTYDPDAEPTVYRHRQELVLEERSLLLLRRA